MAASWSGSDAGPTEYKVAARYYARQNGGLPSVRTAATATEIGSRQNRPAATNPLDIEIPIQVPAEQEDGNFGLVWERTKLKAEEAAEAAASAKTPGAFAAVCSRGKGRASPILESPEVAGVSASGPNVRKGST
jgi:hypothetical protein